MATKKPAIQLSGIDDIIRGGAKAIRSANRVITRKAPRTMKQFKKQGVSKEDAAEIVYGNAGREYGKGFGMGGKNYNPNAFPKYPALTKKEFKKTAAYRENTKKAAKARAKRNIK